MSQHTKYRDPHQGYSRVSEKRRAQRVIEDALAMAWAESSAQREDRADDEIGTTTDLVNLMADQSDAATQPVVRTMSPQSAGSARHGPTAATEGRMIEARLATTTVVRGVMAGGGERDGSGGDAVDRLLASIRRHR